MSPRFLADENVDPDLVLGLRCLLGAIDILRVQEVGLRTVDDSVIVQWAADTGRVVISHDIKIMPGHAAERLAAGLTTPGLILLRSTFPQGGRPAGTIHVMSVPVLMNPVLNTDDVPALVRFYCALLDLHPRDSEVDPEWATLLHPDGSRALSIQHSDDVRATTWPEGGVPLQVHLDLRVADRAALDAEHDRVLGLGATLRLDRSDDPEEPLRAYADPAGHIFCLLTTVATDDPRSARSERRLRSEPMPTITGLDPSPVRASGV